MVTSRGRGTGGEDSDGWGGVDWEVVVGGCVVQTARAVPRVLPRSGRPVCGECERWERTESSRTGQGDGAANNGNDSEG